MKTNLMIAGVLVLGLTGAGCATKKYVVKTVSPVESRVTVAEGKNVEQDKQIAEHAKDIDGLSTDLSRTKERVTDADNKATAAAQSAQRAGERADNAQLAADGAQKAADGARGIAERGLQRVEKDMVAMNKFQMAKTVTVLFALNQSKLTDESKADLDALAKMTNGKDRYIIEVQGFTDKTGSVTANEALSQARASAVARYLANEQKIPVRAITTLGSGYAMPVADDKTREGRKQNRRVEVRLFVPEATQPSNTMAAAQ